MVKRRQVRNRRNRPRSTRSNSKIVKVSHGIPITQRVRGDPPPLNLVSSQTVRVPFYITYNFQQNGEKPFKVTLAASPVGINVIFLAPASGSKVQTFYLDIDEIYQAAAVRVFGSLALEGSINYLSTEFALQTVTFYGPMGSSSIRMGVDFGPGMPGAAAADEGTMTNRPVVKSSATRLYWSRLQQIKAGDAAVGFWIYGFYPIGKSLSPTTSSYDIGGGTYGEQGRIDCTVFVRRSWHNANSAVTSSAKIATTMGDSDVSSMQ